jgi:hypothetical protein
MLQSACRMQPVFRIRRPSSCRHLSKKSIYGDIPSALASPVNWQINVGSLCCCGCGCCAAFALEAYLLVLGPSAVGAQLPRLLLTATVPGVQACLAREISPILASVPPNVCTPTTCASPRILWVLGWGTALAPVALCQSCVQT